MKKRLLDAISTVQKASRYSFAFCFRNNRKDTITIAGLIVAQTLLGYVMILLMGELISSIQLQLTNPRQSPITLKEFVGGGYFLPVLMFIVALFIEIVLQKFRSFIVQRQRHVLRLANNQEMNDLRASLDIARKRSKTYDDIEKKIDELPESWGTRISFAGEMIESLSAVIGLVVFGISLLTTHPIYVCIILAMSIPMVFAEFAAVSRMWKLSLELIPHHKRRSVLQQAFFGTTSFLQGLMFNQLPTLSKQIKDNQDHVLKSVLEARWQNLQISLGAYLFAMAGLSIVLLHSVWGTLSIGGDLGALTVIIGSSRRLQSSIRDIVLQIATQWQSAKGMVMIEEEYFALKPLLSTVNPVDPEFTGPPTIYFNNVSFSYPDKDVLVLRNVSFTIRPRSKVAIVGTNGSGKSSLIGLLLRHYDPTSGSIHIGDLNLNNIAPTVWSKTACALLQNFAIMERTIGSEIASSRLEESIDMEKVRESASFAEFTPIVDGDPKGFDSQIGTEFDGREFSGGEEQRLALARAKYRGTPIFILDEPDAKLDPEASERLMDKIFAQKDTTMIIVTQHVSRAKNADNILVLDNGELVESGTHDELLSKHGKYSSLLTKDKARLSIE
ncbi:MAG: ABC transporter ATP-binding protein [Candidatus Paceibacterota bacterium]|jgi:ABC-type multidrug transport system fused ATPase/permease subunit